MNNKTLYLECFSGISGDMTVASLIDLGADIDILKEGLHSLNVGGYEIEISRTQKCGIDACNFNVILEDDHKHDHKHHDHQEEHKHEDHGNGKGHGHHGDHHHHEGHEDHVHHEHDANHQHRNIEDIYKIIDESEISPRAKTISKKIFDIVAIAESKAHGIEIEKVHFHEVGAIDSIVDIVAVGICIDNLNIEEVIVSELYEGTGHVKCQHGIIPIPVPAVANIVMDNSISIRITDTKGEMITPTGAAIVAALRTKEFLPESFKIKKIGLGAGKKDFPKANLLRAIIIEDSEKKN